MIDDLTTYNTSEVAVMLGVSRATVCWWLRTGKLKGYYHRGNRNRRFWRVFEKDIKIFLHSVYLQEPNQKPTGIFTVRSV